MDEGKKKNLPFSTPTQMRNSASKANTPIYQVSTKKPATSRQMKKSAKKEVKGAISVRRIFGGFFILMMLAVVIYCILVPKTIPDLLSGEFANKTEICKVTETNPSYFFDTDCGRFEWNKESKPGSPKDNLVVGETYEFKSSGLRFKIASTYPLMNSYQLVKK